MNPRPPKYSRAKMAFRTLKSKHRLFLYYDLPSFPIPKETVEKYVEYLTAEKEMQAASKMLEFEYAAVLRDQIIELRKQG